MADVRLTATNPEDSSVVPVACNSKGELLVDKPVIEQINNDVTVEGSLNIRALFGESEDYLWQFDSTSGRVSLRDEQNGATDWSIKAGGLAEFYNRSEVGTARVNIAGTQRPISVFSHEGPQTWYVKWDGTTSSSNYFINLEAGKSEHYSTVRNAQTGEEILEYIGPVLNVREELEFLRAQVRALMEKLKMSPEGGWPVWDGSTET